MAIRGMFNQVQEYALRETIDFDGEFVDASGIDATPSAATLYVKKPDGTVTTYAYPGPSITNPSTGLLVCSVLLDVSGYWSYRWEAIGAIGAADEKVIKVRSSVFFPAA